MKYGQTIRDLAARGQNWRFYDENFRFLRGTQASLVPLGSIHGELWLCSQFPAKALPSSYELNLLANVVTLHALYSLHVHMQRLKKLVVNSRAILLRKLAILIDFSIEPQ